MALVSIDDVLGCLDLHLLRPGVWTAPNMELDYRRIFGGQLLAQSIAIAAATTEAKTVKSVACVFTREGATDTPLEFEVEQTQTGRTFATRRIRAVQSEKIIFVAQVSLHADEPGRHQHSDAAPDVGKPEDAEERDLIMIPWATRVVDGVDLRDRAAGPADYAFWTQIEDRTLADDDSVHKALLAYATDLTVVGTVLRPVEGVSQADSADTIHTAVTSHTMWFHRPFRIDDWCLIHQHSPILANARGFGFGNVFNTSEALVASFAQECMIRPIRTHSS